jgi:hypothetical protein
VASSQAAIRPIIKLAVAKPQPPTAAVRPAAETANCRRWTARRTSSTSRRGRFTATGRTCPLGTCGLRCWSAPTPEHTAAPHNARQPYPAGSSSITGEEHTAPSARGHPELAAWQLPLVRRPRQAARPPRLTAMPQLATMSDPSRARFWVPGPGAVPRRGGRSITLKDAGSISLARHSLRVVAA